MTDAGIVTGSTSNVIDKLSLPELFEFSYKIYETTQDAYPDTTSHEYRKDVSRAIAFLEEATRKVNILGIFSRNETLDEIATQDLKYLVLPALLGNFTLKLHDDDGISRKEILKLSEVYFQNFIERCTEYGVTDDLKSAGSVDKIIDHNDHCSSPKDMESSAKQREIKIQKYKKGKELKSKMKELKRTIDARQSDEMLRDYHILMLKKLVLEVEEDLEQIKVEKNILKHIAQLPDQKEKIGKSEKLQDSKPLKAVIITRNDFQKKVYGAGYPSLPVMTVDEFYQKRYPIDDVKEPPTNQIGNLQLMASDPDAHRIMLEEEDVEKEKKIENDDPGCLQHEREFDDWKDDNRRGCGNRKNMG